MKERLNHLLAERPNPVFRLLQFQEKFDRRAPRKEPLRTIQRMASALLAAFVRLRMVCCFVPVPVPATIRLRLLHLRYSIEFVLGLHLRSGRELARLRTAAQFAGECAPPEKTPAPAHTALESGAAPQYSVRQIASESCERVATPNEPKLSHGGAWRGSCEVRRRRDMRARKECGTHEMDASVKSQLP